MGSVSHGIVADGAALGQKYVLVFLVPIGNINGEYSALEPLFLLEGYKVGRIRAYHLK